MIKQRRVAQFALLFGLVAACGGDDAAASGVSTGFPTQQKLSTLSDDDVQQACHRMNQGAIMLLTPTSLKRAACTSLGVQVGLTVSGTELKVDVAKCQQAVDTCVSDPEKSALEEDDCGTASAMDFEGCEATIGDFEACYNALLDQLEVQIDQLSCQNAEKLMASGYEGDSDATSSPGCQTIMTKCPDVLVGLPQTK